MNIMEEHAYEQAQWRATILAFVISLAALGAEQLIPLSDAMRAQIGVLTVLLMYGFWHLLCAMIRPGEKKG
jgi:hypothetical protein